MGESAFSKGTFLTCTKSRNIFKFHASGTLAGSFVSYKGKARTQLVARTSYRFIKKVPFQWAIHGLTTALYAAKLKYFITNHNHNECIIKNNHNKN